MAQTRPFTPARCQTDRSLARPRKTTKSSTRRKRLSMRITSSIDDMGQVKRCQSCCLEMWQRGGGGGGADQEGFVRVPGFDRDILKGKTLIKLHCMVSGGRRLCRNLVRCKPIVNVKMISASPYGLSPRRRVVCPEYLSFIGMTPYYEVQRFH